MYFTEWFPAVDVHLATTPEKYRAWCEIHDLRMPEPNVAGLSAFTTNGEGDMHAIIYVAGGRSLYRQICTLAHEAVHVADSYFEEIEETKADGEFRAYVVQSIMMSLLPELDEQFKE
jgi:hypothetical protein